MFRRFAVDKTQLIFKIMKAIKYVKLARVSTGYGLGGKNNLYVSVLGDKLGYLPNEDKPYTPIGGIKALISVRDILVFK